jgi:hypothetical protein
MSLVVVIRAEAVAQSILNPIAVFEAASLLQSVFHLHQPGDTRWHIPVNIQTRSPAVGQELWNHQTVAGIS